MSSIESFVDVFFGDSNQLTIEHPSVAQLAEKALEEWPDAPVALPRVGDSRAPDLVRWYVLSPAASEDGRLAEELGSWLGPTYSASWTGQASELDLGDPIERAALELGAGAVFIVDVAQKDRDRARSNLEQLRELWAERPRERVGLPARASELIRDLNLSLANGNPQTAREILSDIDHRSLLSAENELFLAITVLEAESRWSDLASHPHLVDLSARRRPWPVTRALLTGLYRVELAGAEHAEDLEPWIEKAGELEARAPGLFSTRGPLDRPEIAKAFALVDRAHSDRPLRTRARVFEANGLTPADRAFLDAVVDATESPAPADPLDEARRLLADGDYDPAWDRAIGLDPSSARTVILIQSAVELATASAAREALDALDAMSDDVATDLMRGSRRLARDVEELKAFFVSPDDVSDTENRTESWEDWLRSLHSRKDWPEGTAVAEKGVYEWRGDDLLAGDSAEMSELILHTRSSAQERVFLESAPLLLEWLTQLGTSPSLVGVKKAFLEAVCLGDVRADVALETALGLAESIIDSGVDGSEYADVLANLEAIWDAQASVRSVPWLADCFELLGDLPGDKTMLSEVAARMVGRASATILRADDLSVRQLTDAAHSLGIDREAIPQAHHSASSVGAEIAGELKGKRIGLYTLTPHVGTRVKHQLEKTFPGASVIVNSDTTSSDKLRNLAQTADHLIVMLRSATHAATDAIAAARPRSAPTLRVGCRGSSGVVAAFLDSLQPSA